MVITSQVFNIEKLVDKNCGNWTIVEKVLSIIKSLFNCLERAIRCNVSIIKLKSEMLNASKISKLMDVDIDFSEI